MAIVFNVDERCGTPKSQLRVLSAAVGATWVFASIFVFGCRSASTVMGVNMCVNCLPLVSSR